MERNRNFGPKKCGLDATKDELRLWNLQAETSQSHSEQRKQLKSTSHTHVGSVM